VGEPPIIPAPAAVANALQDATGVRLTVLPLTPERVALGIAANGNGSNGHANGHA
jgi:CO/xanthine dehydrogenase Mo-binding subunit